MDFDISLYSTVAERIECLAIEHPNFKMSSEATDIYIDEQAYIRVKVTIWKSIDDLYPWVNGLAQERANKPFALENAETSAYGRALANANYASKLGTPRSSAEEMVAFNDLWNTNQDLETAGPSCKHGARIMIEGISKKTNEPYRGYKCSAKDEAEQCEMQWHVKSLTSGTWRAK